MTATRESYKGYQIEFDAEFGYIVCNGCRDLAEFETRAEAIDLIDHLVADVHEARNRGGY